MITEDYVSFESAKLLKEKGFDEYCLKNYWESDKELHGWTWELSYGKNSEKNTCCKDCSAPTLQMAMKWLREVHKILISFNASFVNSIEPHFSWEIRINSITSLNDEKHFEPIYIHIKSESFEKACEAAIKYCLEILI